MEREKKFVLWFDEVTKDDVPLVGGKNASLGEMYRNLVSEGVNVPGGFAVTAYAYKYLLEETNIRDKLVEILSELDVHDLKNLRESGKKIRDLISGVDLPNDLRETVLEAYHKMQEKDENLTVAVRSSATAEDLPDASFAGQQETYLNVKGDEDLIEACKDCFASLFTNRAISYREDKGFNHLDVYLSIAVQKMVRSDLASSGVMFSIDTESGFENVVFITGSWGLGENVVQGKVNPDEYYVFKPTLKEGYIPIVGKKLGSKEIKMIYSSGAERVKDITISEEERNSFTLTDEEVVTLGRWAMAIENHYEKPMDIEWAKDGNTGELYIVQARPETVHSQRELGVITTYELKEEGKVLATGQAVGQMIGQGTVNIIESAEEIEQFRKGEVLVTDMTDPDWEPIMKIAGAIVTNKGGRTCHAAIVSRELGIPCIIGTEDGTEKLKSGQKVTTSCAEGETGKVYEGLLEYAVEKTKLDVPETKTQIMMNVGIPEKAFAQGQIPCDGVGLAREEFIINSYIGIHPLALLNYEELKKSDDSEKKKVATEIEKKTKAYSDKTQFFIDTLARGIGKIAAGFYPNDVIVRLSDFKTNEYANLIGGQFYEPEESNPMIGWRGASRYYDEDFKPAFGLECEALKKVRNEMGLTNVKAMVPFCRTPEEGKKVIKVMEEYGLKQGENGLEVYVMCEIPSNVVAADQFADVFDGFSIGSNDLTQLTLGLDRDSELVSHIFDERNDAVKRLVKQVIDTAHQHTPRRKVGICGQAPSDYPEFAEYLVECGIDSISLNPDTVIKTKLQIAGKEKEMKK
ncbi:MAG: phosphoenolpyruvate synthase [Euryarchaeota archaeon]|nr:phosphoenolpyruvate synthase [Euryarchaeota archaeon]